ncbi:helix-turn-helix domain-containing protein [Mucilaginibacter flavus]|uniref:helix-turn-helix domain-containing protein n=1 Tax=Mucilaginibacter flavus TaxID=931504 RepID=UPI0025B5391E|nr:helix-turn-helix transcriptional regulator [Mucilaginibacter flavus]
MNHQQRKYPNRLRVVRQSKGYSQKKVAKMLGYKKTGLLSDWENEKSMPNATNLFKLCIIYNKATRELYPEYYQRVAQDIESL